MTEPFYIAQTFEPEHVSYPAAMREWFKQRAQDAAAKGGTFPRYTIYSDGSGLLFECWTDRPKDQGEPRWQLQYSG